MKSHGQARVTSPHPPSSRHCGTSAGYPPFTIRRHLPKPWATPSEVEEGLRAEADKKNNPRFGG